VPEYCHDCGTPLGAYHHEYCNIELCADCGGQLPSCEHSPHAPGAARAGDELATSSEAE
jgi:hypothetical protein